MSGSSRPAAAISTCSIRPSARCRSGRATSIPSPDSPGNSGPRLTVTGNLLGSSDDIALADDADREERAQAEHQDEYRWLRLDHRLPGGAVGRTLLTRAEFDSTRSGTSEKAGLSSGTLTDIRDFSIRSAQTEWSWPLGERWLIEFGGQLSHVEGRYDYSEDVSFDLLFDVPGTPATPARQRNLAVVASGRPASAHVAFRHRITDRITGDFGLRWDDSSLNASDGSAMVPRLGIRFDITGNTELRASVGRLNQTQAINELPISDGVDFFFPRQSSDQAVVGLLHEFPAGGTLRVEAYRKRMHDLNPRFENMLNARVLLPELKPDRVRIEPLSAAAHGLELMYQSPRERPLDWWVSWSWARVEDRFATDTIPRSWDQPLSLGAGIEWTIGQWQLALASTFRSGWPTTTVALDDSGAIPIVVAGRRNDSRFRHYRSIDVLASRTFEFERSSLALTIELTNLLDRRNPCCTEYEIGDDEDEAGQLLLKELAYLPIVPSVGIRWSF